MHPADPHRARSVDPDVDLHDPDQLAEIRPHEIVLLAVIAAGGVVGAEARYGVGRLLPAARGEFPWATLIVNVSGCLLIGVLMVLLAELWSPHRFTRPFLGVGVLGGYTTFSTFGIEAVGLVREHRPAVAAGYIVASLVLCLLAVHGASAAAGRLLRSDDAVGAAR